LIERSGDRPYILWIHDVDIKLGHGSQQSYTSRALLWQCSWR
jgi:hypothetical protein